MPAGKRRGSRLKGRNLHTRVKTAKGRKASSTRWLQRQLNDPYVRAAERLGYRSRAAFKLAELDQRFHFLKPGCCVVDLGAAPGGWTQVAVERVKVLYASSGKRGHVVGIDVKEMEPIAGAVLLAHDFMTDDATAQLKDALAGPTDVVLSDMATQATGHAATDHMRIMTLLEAAADFATDVLCPGGVFVGKVLQGGTENQLLGRLKLNFKTVKHAKPPASRTNSAETYVIAEGFRSGGRE